MEEPHHRLQRARKDAGYESAKEAAEAFGWKIPTYLGHENGSRGLRQDAAMRYAKAFRVNWSWLLDPSAPQKARTVPVVGFVGAGGEIVYGDPEVAQELDDEVEAPPGVDDMVEAVIVKGDSMYPVYRDRQVIYYRKAEHVSPRDLTGDECVVRLGDGRTLVKQIYPGSEPGTYTLLSYNAPPIEDVNIEWAVPVLWVKKR